METLGIKVLEKALEQSNPNSVIQTLIIDLIEYEKTKDDMYKLNEIKVELTNKKDTNPIMMKKKLKLTKSQVDRLNNIKA